MAKLDSLQLRARFLANAPANVLVIWPNQPNVSPDPTKPFIRFSFGPTSSTRDVLGTPPRERTIGRIYLAVFVPAQTGTSLADDLADQCATVFRNWRWRLGGAGIDCGTPEFASFDQEPEWYQVRVSIPWESQRTY